MACLDSTFLVDILRESRRRKEGTAHAKLKEISTKGDHVVTTIINAAEILNGGYDAGAPSRSLHERERLLAGITVLDLDMDSARQYAIWDSILASRGEMTGAFDLMIASIAFNNGHSVVTKNTKDFECIPGLNVESY